jgi:hypothetical protein|tara:strand:- start:11 stop:820 length:810 start_codon:yes stop_codon:yes gene_type:complete
MKKIFLLPLILVIISCGDSESEDQNSETSETNNDFPSYVDSNNLRIFARKGVSSTFLNNVGAAYGEMLKDNSKIDQSMKSKYLSTSKDEYVYQRVGVDGMASGSNFDSGTPPKPYGDNATDYIWEMSSGGEDQIGEVIEHLLHTVTAVGLYLNYSDWDYKSSSSPLYLAMREAVDKNIYDISSYDNIKNDDAYERILAQEYAYWLILAEWDYYETTGKKENGMTGNGEFTLGTPPEIKSQLPLGHKLYEDYIEKIFSIPNKENIIALFP